MNRILRFTKPLHHHKCLQAKRSQGSELIHHTVIAPYKLWLQAWESHPVLEFMRLLSYCLSRLRVNYIRACLMCGRVQRQGRCLEVAPQ